MTRSKKYNQPFTGAPRVRKKREHPESDLQIMFVKWARLQYPILNKMLFAIPNGGKRHAAEAAIMVGEGVVAGVYDLFVSIPTRPDIFPGHHGLYMETKAPGVKKMSAKQSEWGRIAQSLGYKTVMYNNFDDGRVLLTEYMQQTIFQRILA